MKMHRATQTRRSPFEAQVAFARAATALGGMSLGALAVGATAMGAVAIGALAIMFVVTGTSHFTAMKYDLAAMMPEPLPDGLWIIYLSGVLEIAGAIGLLIPRTRRLAGIGLVLLMVGVFPANVNAALGGIPFGGEAPTPLWLRAPEQLLYIGKCSGGPPSKHFPIR